MPGKEEEPLVPYHIIHGEQHSQAIAADIRDLINVMRAGERPDREGIATIVETQAFIRMVSLGVLDQLGALGAIEAPEVAARLETMDLDDRPLTSDLSGVATSYDEEYQVAISNPEAERLKGLFAFSYASFGIAVYAAQRLHEGDDTTGSAQLFPSAEEAVSAARPNVSAESYTALTTLLDELRVKS